MKGSRYPVGRHLENSPDIVFATVIGDAVEAPVSAERQSSGWVDAGVICVFAGKLMEIIECPRDCES